MISLVCTFTPCDSLTIILIRPELWQSFLKDQGTRSDNTCSIYLEIYGSAETPVTTDGAVRLSRTESLAKDTVVLCTRRALYMPPTRLLQLRGPQGPTCEVSWGKELIKTHVSYQIR